MRNRGFTLIELLVVIAILGVLASIVLISFRGTREDAQRAAAEQFASQLDRGLGSSILGRWDLDGNANDTSGYGNNGTATGVTPTTDRRDQENRAYQKSSDGDRIELGTTSAFGGLPEVTVSGWIYLDSLPSGNNEARIFEWGTSVSGEANRILLYVRHTDHTVRFLINNAHGVGSNGPSLSSGRWYHVAGVFKGEENTSVYVNGEQADKNTSAIAASTTSGSFPAKIVYSAYSIGHAFRGKVDDIHIYNRALSSAEIRQYYAETMPKYQVSVDRNL